MADYKPARLDKAKSIGAIPVDFTKGDPVEQIINMIVSNPGITGSKLPGEEKRDGFMNGIDAVGYRPGTGKTPPRRTRPRS